MVKDKAKGILLHESQKLVAKCDDIYRVVCCGRQWGKTTLSVLEMVALAYAKGDREVAYFATTYDQARNIAWNMLKDFTRGAWSKAPNEYRLELTINTQDKGVSKISLRGFENVETARGQQFDLLVIDEVAQMRNWEYSWQAILEPTLAFREGKALFISTPRGFNHFYKMYNLGQDPASQWKSWRFTSYDNPHLPRHRIDNAKLESTEDYFAQEYMADFRMATGLAHKAWSREVNVIDPFEIPKNWQRARGFDYGSAHPTASVRVAIDEEGNYFVERCYKDMSRSIEEHAEAIKAQDFNFGHVPCWGDPSGKQWSIEFDKYNLHIEQANKEVGQGARGWVEHCVERINTLLKEVPGHDIYLPNGTHITNAPKLFVLNNKENQELIEEIERLKWRETTAGETVPILDEADDPNGHYDLMASLRYLLVSYSPRKTDYKKIDYKRKWGLL